MAKQNTQRKPRALAETKAAGNLRAVKTHAADARQAEPATAAATASASLDRLIHERLRLGILSALAVNRSMAFNDLKETLKTTDGNLSVHARKLEDAEYITCVKSFDGRTPKTEYRLATAGRRALEHYLDHMESLIRATRAPR